MSSKRSRFHGDHITEASDLIHERQERDDEPNRSTAYTLQHTKYTTEILLIANNVNFLTVDDFCNYPRIEARLQELHSHVNNSLAPNEADNGTILENAKVFSKALMGLADTPDPPDEQEWTSQFKKIWQFSRMDEYFHYRRDKLWSYDAGLMNYLPGRKSLRQPKPDYAFGLAYDLKNPEEKSFARAAMNIKAFTEPAVDIICTGNVVMPFLVGEAKSRIGIHPVAVRQMCNALIKCHDNLSALKLSEQLIIYSFIHIGPYMTLYFSVSSSETNEKAMTLAEEIFVVKVDEFVLNEQGTFRFLKFVEHVKAYGMGTYATTVKQALAKFAQDITAKGLVLRSN